MLVVGEVVFDVDRNLVDLVLHLLEFIPLFRLELLKVAEGIRVNS